MVAHWTCTIHSDYCTLHLYVRTNLKSYNYLNNMILVFTTQTHDHENERTRPDTPENDGLLLKNTTLRLN